MKITFEYVKFLTDNNYLMYLFISQVSFLVFSSEGE